jgi:hypothetical protein
VKPPGRCGQYLQSANFGEIDVEAERDGREPDEDGEPSLCGLTSDRRDHAAAMGM